MDFFDQTIFHLAGHAVSGTQVTWAVIVLVVGTVVAFRSATYLGRRLLWPGSAGGHTVPIILGGMRTKIIFFSLLGALAVLGVNVMPVIWILLAVGAIVALAWRSVAEQFTAGFSILWERPFMLGERIKVGEHEGEVERVGLRATTLRSEERVAIHVPNAYLITHAIFNRSKTEGGMGLTIPVEVAMGTESGDVIAALRKAAERNNRVRSSPSPKAFMTGFTTTGLTFELRAWVNNYAEAPWAQNELCRAIQSEFQRAGLRFSGAGVTSGTVSEERRSRSRTVSATRTEDPPRGETPAAEVRPSRRRSDRREDKPERGSRRGGRESSGGKPRGKTSSRSTDEDGSSLELPLAATAAAPVANPEGKPDAEETIVEVKADSPRPQHTPGPDTTEKAEVTVQEITPDPAPPQEGPASDPEAVPAREPVPVAAAADTPAERAEVKQPDKPKRKSYGRSRRKLPRK